MRSRVYEQFLKISYYILVGIAITWYPPTSNATTIEAILRPDPEEYSESSDSENTESASSVFYHS